MDNMKEKADLSDLFLNSFPSLEDGPLPMPRFGKVPQEAQQAQLLPAVGAHAADKVEEAISFSWLDEDDLGIRVFIMGEQGSQGIDICAYAEGVRPELLGKAVSVALVAANGDRFKRLTITLDQADDGKSICSGKGSFGAAAELHKRLGERVNLDVFLLE